MQDNTGVFPVSYDPTDKNDDFLGIWSFYLNFWRFHVLSFLVMIGLVLILLDPEGELCSYLDDLASSSDVQDYIKEHSFGQPMIDSSHPDWSFYSKVIKDYYLAYVC